MDISAKDLSMILEKINLAEWLPSPNQALMRCLKLFAEEDVPIKKIEDTFKTDVSLCSQVLKVANSAFYGLSNHICDISKAVMIIGLREIKNIYLTAALMQQFPKNSLAASFDFVRFWRHSMLASFISHELAVDKAWITGEDAQIYGLLHDMGMLVMAALLPGQFEKVTELSQKEGKPFQEAEKAFGITHSYLGWALAKKWGLPEPVRLIARWHHDPSKGDACSRQAALINVSSYLACIIGESSANPKITPPSDEIMSLADISQQELRNYLETLNHFLEKTDAFIQAIT